MPDFEYRIIDGICEYQTSNAHLYVVKRSLANNQASNFTTNTYVETHSGGGAISLLYRKEKLGGLRLWHDIRSTNPNRLALQLVDTLDRPTNNREGARVIMTKFALFAASGLLDESTHARSIDLVVQAIPRYEDTIPMNPHLHSISLGSIAAQLRRSAQAS